jgi:hypothetical protein
MDGISTETKTMRTLAFVHCLDIFQHASRIANETIQRRYVILFIC